jgi:RNA polymerase sigma factor (sigma-70 family)
MTSYVSSPLPQARSAVAGRRPPAAAGELERLVVAASTGDRTALSDLVKRFAPRVRSVARMHRLAADDVEDVMQTTWLRLVQHVHTIRDPNAVGAWLERTARRESLRVLGANSREIPTDSERMVDVPVAPVDEQRLHAAERRAALAMALQQLTGDRQELISMLFADDGPSYSEISRALNLPVGSIGPTRARCLARLRKSQDLNDVTDTGDNRVRSNPHPCVGRDHAVSGHALGVAARRGHAAALQSSSRNEADNQ